MILRERGHEVISFVEQALDDELVHDNTDWIWSESGEQKFHFDLNGACGSDLVIYIGPSGTDAWAEVGAAWGTGNRIIGFYAKGEGQGLMQRMMRSWHHDLASLLAAVVHIEAEVDGIKWKGDETKNHL